MQDSNLSSKQSSQNSEEQVVKKNPREKKFALLFLILAIFGFADATYLTLKHFSGTAITCSLSQGCGEVTSSAYSEVFGIPVALFGALFYLTVILLSVYFLDRKKEEVLRLISKLTWLGLGAAIYFTSVQAFILHAWCQYCIVSAITSTLLFITGMIYLKKSKPSKKLDAPTSEV